MAITSIKTGSSFTNLIKYNDFLGPNAAFIPNSFESIATVTAASDVSVLSFTSIPSTYKHLQIRGISRQTGSGGVDYFYINFNSDTATNYSNHYLQGNGSSASAVGTATNGTPIIGVMSSDFNTANIWSASIIDVQDYASTAINKTVRSFSGADTNSTNGYVNLLSMNWRSTAAITRIDIKPYNNSIKTGSTFALYGIN